MKLSQKRSVEANALLQKMLANLACFFAYVGTVRELIEDVLVIQGSSVEVLTSTAVGDPQTNEEPWVPAGVGLGALELEQLRTILTHTTSEEILTEEARRSVGDAVKKGLQALRNARKHLKVQNRRPLHHLQAKHELDTAEEMARAIGRLLASRIAEIQSTLFAEPSGPTN